MVHSGDDCGPSSHLGSGSGRHADGVHGRMLDGTAGFDPITVAGHRRHVFEAQATEHLARLPEGCRPKLKNGGTSSAKSLRQIAIAAAAAAAARARTE